MTDLPPIWLPDDGLTPSELSALRLGAHQTVRTEARNRATARTSPGDGFQLEFGPTVALEVEGKDVVSNHVRRSASQLPSRPLADILNKRRSSSHLSRCPVELVVALLGRTYRIQQAGFAADGSPWTLRPVPSAGATHPFDLLLSASEVDGIDRGRYVFDPHRVALRPLAAKWNDYANILEHATLVASRATQAPPAAVTLVAEINRTAHRYSAPLTLLLRDAGVLLQTLHLVATDVGLGSRIVGSTGHIADRRSRAGSLIVDCGALIIGRVEPGEST